MLEEIVGGITDVRLDPDCDLTKFSTMRLKSRGDLIHVESVGALKSLLPKLTGSGIPYRLLGWGANQLLPEKASGVFIKLDFPFDREGCLSRPLDEYRLPASVSLAVLTSHAVRHGLKGWEVFTGIPASLGGAVYMNAGTSLGEIGSLVKEVVLVGPDGKERCVTVDKNSFSYRTNHFVGPGDVIVEVRLVHDGLDPKISEIIKKYLKKRSETQPLGSLTCGCIFKNNSPTCTAGRYIDIMGLGGLRFKDVAVSEKHANFLENRGVATAQDVKDFIGIIKDELELNYGTLFETEVKLDS